MHFTRNTLILPLLASLYMTSAQAQPTATSKPSAETDKTVPLKNPLNRNPARRAKASEEAPPPADPRDSTVRPVTPVAPDRPASAPGGGLKP